MEANTDPKRPQVIRGGLVLDADAYLGARDILIVDGVIKEIGPPGMAAPPDAAVIDASRRLIHPGLVNSHAHGHGNLARSTGDRWNLEMLVAAAPYMYGLWAAEEKKISAMIGASEMVLKGCTAVYDLFVEMPGITEDGIDAVGEAHDTVGNRAVIAPLLSDRSMLAAIPGLREVTPTALRDEDNGLPWRTSIERTRNIIKNWRFDSSRVRPGVAPTIPMYCSDEFMIAVRDLAVEFDLPVSSHVSESKVEAVAGRQMYGRSIVAQLEKLGLLSEKFTAAHSVWLDPDDMRMLADAGSSIAHNPSSNMRLGNGIADIVGMLAAGVNVGIGTDGGTCSDNLNMYIAMQMAAVGSRAVSPDPADWLSSEQVFHAATLGSAQALGFDRIGRVAVGYQADLVLLDLDAPTLIPFHAPFNQLVLGEDGTSVDSVMIGGRFVVRGGKLLTVDLPKLASRAADLRADLKERGMFDLTKFEPFADVLAAFCPAISMTPWTVNRYCGCGPHSRVFEATEVTA